MFSQTDARILQTRQTELGVGERRPPERIESPATWRVLGENTQTCIYESQTFPPGHIPPNTSPGRQRSPTEYGRFAAHLYRHRTSPSSLSVRTADNVKQKSPTNVPEPNPECLKSSGL